MMRSARGRSDFFRFDNTVNGVLDVLAATAGGAGVVGVVLTRPEAGFQFVLPLAVAVGGDVFGADSGDGLQQELGEIAEGDGVFAGDASLGHEEKSLGEGSVDAGGGGEVGAERFERRCVRYALGSAFLLRRMMSAEMCLGGVLHWRPSAKVNWQREAEALREVLRSGSSLRTPILVGSASLSEGLLAGASEWRWGLSWEITDFKKEAGLGPVGGSFAIVICNVTLIVSTNVNTVFTIRSFE